MVATTANGHSEVGHKLDEALAAWVDAYRQLEGTRERLKSANGPSAEALHAEFDRLQAVAAAKLRTLQVEFDRAKKS